MGVQQTKAKGADNLEMVEPESVFKLSNLDTNKQGKYLLSVYQPVPFGMGKNVFLVDKIVNDTPPLRGIAGVRDNNEVVVYFPDSFQFMLINRDQYEVISMEEAKKQIEEMEKEEVPTKEIEVVSPGRFTHL